MTGVPMYSTVPILVLDEATSFIDSQTESLIGHAVQKIMAGRTALVIAHPLSTIHAVNKIFVMHNGEICESGDHQVPAFSARKC